MLSTTLRRASVPAALALAPAAALAQATIFVPTDQPTIQAGIDAASNGDQVVVLPGTYFEHDLDFGGKFFTLRSTRGPEETIIDAQGLGRVFVFDDGEPPLAVLRGFTLQNGVAPDGIDGPPGSVGLFGAADPGGPGGDGGAIYLVGASPRILDCIFRGNRAGRGGAGGVGGNAPFGSGGDVLGDGGGGGDGGAGGRGGAIFCDVNAAPLFGNCVFVDNAAGDGGPGSPGGQGGSGTPQPGFSQCFSTPGGDGGDGGDGGSGGPGGSGGAIGISISGAIPTFFGCTLVGNTPGAGGEAGAAGLPGPGGAGVGFGHPLCPHMPGLHGSSGSAGVPGPDGVGGAMTTQLFGHLTGCIVWGNGPSPLDNVTSVIWSDVEGGHVGTGNIDADPLFVDGPGGDFRLAAGSPCIDAGENWGVGLSTLCTDLDGNQRLADDPSVPDSGSGTGPILDMGPYERGADTVLLSASPAAISLSAGGSQTYSLDACMDHAGEIYVLLGTASGTIPGTPFAGVLLPLNILGDPFFDFVIANAGGPMFPGFLGILDGAGQASASFVVPPGTAPSAAGLVFDFAYVTFHPLTGKTLAASNPVSMTALP